jgi:maleylacetoacetate isomerase
MQVHSYFNSSTSFRVRIALALKGVGYEYIPVNLRTQSQRSAKHLELNPSAGVPVISDGDFVLTQSLTI